MHVSMGLIKHKVPLPRRGLRPDRASYKALYERGSKTVRPDVTWLEGDQVYLD